jgi:CubicO group peptidase (beta-lactamase class C family)
VPGQPERSYLQKTDQTMHSAGGLISTASDMARWLQVQINDGVLDGERVLPAGLVTSTHSVRVEQNTRFGPYIRSG